MRDIRLSVKHFTNIGLLYLIKCFLKNIINLVHVKPKFSMIKTHPAVITRQKAGKSEKISLRKKSNIFRVKLIIISFNPAVNLHC